MCIIYLIYLVLFFLLKFFYFYLKLGVGFINKFGGINFGVLFVVLIGLVGLIGKGDFKGGLRIVVCYICGREFGLKFIFIYEF